MTNERTYNGWTNYETWLVYCWMTNDQDSVQRWERLADSHWEVAEATNVWTKKESATYDLSDAFKEYLEAESPLESGMYADLIKAALAEVNFDELAKHYYSEREEEEETTC